MPKGWPLCEIMAVQVYMVIVIVENRLREPDERAWEPGQQNKPGIGGVHASFVLDALYRACLGFVGMSSIVFEKL